MSQTTTSAEARAVAELVRLLEFDPWSLTLAERRELRRAMASAQAAWLPRIQGLIEPPPIDGTFPAFLLSTPAFADLAQGIGPARRAHELCTATADRLQRFVDRYRDYLGV
jgi:hypothetical protein